MGNEQVNITAADQACLDVVASLKAGVTGLGVPETDAGGLEVVEALEGLGRMVQAAQAQVSKHLVVTRERARLQQKRSTRDVRAGLGRDVGLHRRTGLYRARRLVDAAADTEDIAPTLWALWRAGDVSQEQVLIFLEETSLLMPETRVEVDAQLSTRVPQLGDRELRRELALLVAKLEPELAEERYRKALSRRHVSLRARSDGMMNLSALLPGVAGQGVSTILGVKARSLRSGGDDRTEAQIKADLLTGIILAYAQTTHPHQHTTSNRSRGGQPSDSTGTGTAGQARPTGADPGGDGADAPLNDSGNTVEGPVVRTTGRAGHRSGPGQAVPDFFETHRIHGTTPTPDPATTGDTNTAAAARTGAGAPEAGWPVEFDVPARPGGEAPPGGRSGFFGEVPELPAGEVGFAEVVQAVAAFRTMIETAARTTSITETSAGTTGITGTLTGRGVGGPGRVWPVGVGVQVQLVMTDLALFGITDTPAELFGLGPVPAGVARQMIHTANSDDAAVFRRLYTDPAGNLTRMESTSRTFPKGLGQMISLRDRSCRHPYCDADIRHLDHIRPHSAGGPTSFSNGQGLCAGHNLIKDTNHTTTTPDTTTPSTGSSGGPGRSGGVVTTLASGRTFTCVQRALVHEDPASVAETIFQAGRRQGRAETEQRLKAKEDHADDLTTRFLQNLTTTRTLQETAAAQARHAALLHAAHEHLKRQAHQLKTRELKARQATPPRQRARTRNNRNRPH